MKQLVILIFVVLMDCTGGQYPDCVECTDGSSISLLPLSYNTRRSHVFNGVQPSNERCVPIDGEVTTNCGQGTTLIDCDRGYNDNVDYSDLSNYFIWNTSLGEQVFIDFRFGQEVRGRRISMFFWNSPSNSIIVPTVRIDWSSHNMLFVQISTITTNSPNRTEDGQCRLDIDINNAGLQFQYLRILMNFYSNNEWIFLSEVQFCGSTAPFHITQPSTDNDVQIVSPTATMATLTCSLNVTIPSDAAVTWRHNNTINIPLSQVSTTGSTTTLTIENPQSSDTGDYECIFNDVIGSGWILRRNIILLITDTTTTTTTTVTDSTVPTTTTTTMITDNTVPTTTTTTTVVIDSTVPTTTTADIVPTTTSVSDTSTASVDITSTAIDNIVTSTVLTTAATGTTAADITMTIAVTTSSTAITHTNVQTIATVSNSVSTTAIATSIAITTIDIATNAATTATAITSSASSTIGASDSFMSATTVSATTATPITSSTSSTTDVSDSTMSTMTVSPNSIPSTDDSSSSDSVTIAIVSIVVIVLLIAIVVVFIIMIYYWRKRWNSYHIYGGGKTDDDDTELDEQPPLSPLYATVDVVEEKVNTKEMPPAQYVKCNQKPSQTYATINKKEKKEKKKSTEPQKRSSIEFESRSGCSPDISIRSSQEPPTLSVINPDYEMTGFNIYSSAPDIPERTEASHGVAGHGMVFDDKDEENPIYNLNDNPMYSEAINPVSIISDLSSNYSATDDQVSPYASIYTEPLPLVKSEGPPVVSTMNIKPLHKLGNGLFGEVMLAETVGLSYRYLGIGNSTDDTISMKVAVKMLRSSPSKEMQNSFEKEIKFMSRLKDDNVIRLLGICTIGTPFIMMEYMQNGDLSAYLQKFKFAHNADKLPAAQEITLNALIYMSHQIASGMKYLSSCNFIHRDLAARNVLVGFDYTVKIADFGMSQNLYSEYYCRIGGQKILPIRWMACECFYGKFSVKTDVWAFGITLWEIFTLCRCLPYDDMTNHQLIEDAVKGANRKIPKQPKFCPNEIYTIMKSCWQHETSQRANFNMLCHQLNEYYSSIL